MVAYVFVRILMALLPLALARGLLLILALRHIRLLLAQERAVRPLTLVISRVVMELPRLHMLILLTWLNLAFRLMNLRHLKCNEMDGFQVRVSLTRGFVSQLYIFEVLCIGKAARAHQLALIRMLGLMREVKPLATIWLRLRHLPRVRIPEVPARAIALLLALVFRLAHV